MAERQLEPPRGSIRGRQIEPEEKAASGKTSFSSLRKKIRKSIFYAKGSLDIPFLAATIALLTIGLVMLFSASYPYAFQKFGDSYYFFKRQLIFAVGGVVVMLGVSKLNFKFLKVILWPLTGLTYLLLIIVLFYHVDLGREEDFKRWIPIGPITVQPSDIAKFTLVLMLAWFFSKYKKQVGKNDLYGILCPLIITGSFAGLILLENHLSCTILIVLIGFAMTFCGGSRKVYFIAAISIIAVVAFVVIKNPDVLPSAYQADRIRAWTQKDFDPLGLRWQTNNSLYAIGSGGFWGVGLGNSKQKYLYVSEPQNDFIFSIVCEELGFIGATLIIVLFGILFWRGIKIAQRCESTFPALVVTGIVLQVAIQTIFNILVVTDTFPNTGIALPFFSYGGTAILILCFEMGVVLSISRSVNTKNY